jgi:hypothetical protein
VVVARLIAMLKIYIALRIHFITKSSRKSVLFYFLFDSQYVLLFHWENSNLDPSWITSSWVWANPIRAEVSRPMVKWEA